ncbi:MAG: hypothetical protein U0231_07920 [Nitrospiraceae bacterium]
MGSKLYVGSLPYSTTDDQLADLFKQHGAECNPPRSSPINLPGSRAGSDCRDGDGKMHSERLRR